MTFLTKIQNVSPYFGFILDLLYANSLYARFVQDVSIAYNEGRLYCILGYSRPAGQMWPAEVFNLARSAKPKIFYIFDKHTR